MVTQNEEADSTTKQEDEQPIADNDVSTSTPHKDTLVDNTEADNESGKESSESLTKLNGSLRQEITTSESIRTNDNPTEVGHIDSIETNPSNITPEIKECVNSIETPYNSLPTPNDTSSIDPNNASIAIEESSHHDDMIQGNNVPKENTESVVESDCACEEVESTQTSVAIESMDELPTNVQSSVDTDQGTKSTGESESRNVEQNASMSETCQGPTAVVMSGETHGDICDETTSNENNLGNTPPDSTSNQMIESNQTSVTSSEELKCEPMVTECPMEASSTKEAVSDNAQLMEVSSNITEQTNAMKTDQTDSEVIQGINQLEGDSKEIKESDNNVKPTVESNINDELNKTNETVKEGQSEIVKTSDEIVKDITTPIECAATVKEGQTEIVKTSDEIFKDITTPNECAPKDKKEGETSDPVENSNKSSEDSKTAEEVSNIKAPETSNTGVETSNAGAETSNTGGAETSNMEAAEGVKELNRTEGDMAAEGIKEVSNEGEGTEEDMVGETPYLLVTGDNLNMLEIENLSKELCGTEFMVEMDTNQPSEPSYRPNALAPAGTELPNLPLSDQPVSSEVEPAASPATSKKRVSVKRSKSTLSAKSDGGESGAVASLPSGRAAGGATKTKAGRAKLRISMPNLKLGGGMKKKSKVGGGSGTPARKTLAGATPKKGVTTKLSKTKGSTPVAKPKRAKSLGNLTSKTGCGTPGGRGKKTTTPDEVINNALYKVPLLEFGWFRELVHRKGSTPQKRQGDIYYFTPEPERKKYRSRNEIERILPKDSPLRAEHFSFCKTLIGLGPDYERERGATNPGTALSHPTPGKAVKRKSQPGGTPAVKKASPKKRPSLLASAPATKSGKTGTPVANKRVPKKSIKILAMEETDKENEEAEDQGSEEKSKTVALGAKRKSLPNGDAVESKAKSKPSSVDTKDPSTPRGRKSKGKLVDDEDTKVPIESNDEEMGEKRKTPKSHSSEKMTGKLKLKLTAGKVDKEKSTKDSLVAVQATPIESKREKVVLKEKNSSPSATSVSRDERAKRNASLAAGGGTPGRETLTAKKSAKSTPKVEPKDVAKTPKIGPASKTERTSIYASSQDKKRRGNDVRTPKSEAPTSGSKSSAQERSKSRENVSEKSGDKSSSRSSKFNGSDSSEDRKVAPISLTITKSPQKTIVSIKKSTDGRKPEIKVEIRKPSSLIQSETKKAEESRSKMDTDSGSSDEVLDGKKSKSGFFETIKTRKRSGFTLSQEECDIISGAKKPKRSPNASPLNKIQISPAANISNEETVRLSNCKVMLSPCHSKPGTGGTKPTVPAALEPTTHGVATSGRNKRTVAKTLEAEFDKIDKELLTAPPAVKRKRLGVHHSAKGGSGDATGDSLRGVNGVGSNSSERKSQAGNNKAVKSGGEPPSSSNSTSNAKEKSVKEGEGKRKKKESVTMNGGETKRLTSSQSYGQSSTKFGSLVTSDVTKSNPVYSWLVHLLSYLTVQDRLRAARACKLFHLAAQHPSLWTHIRMKNSRVSNWSGCASSFSRHQTELLDMKKMILPSSGLGGQETSCAGVDPIQLMWIQLPSHLKRIGTLRTLDLGKCSSGVFEHLKENLTQLVSLSATLHKGQPVILSHFNAMINLVKLKLKGYEIKKGAQNIYGVDHLSRLGNLRHLALTSVGNLNSVTLDSLTQACPQLTALELGSCAHLTAKDGAKLSRLTSLQKLRLEILVTGASNAFLTQVSKMPQLTHLELINVDVTEGFDEVLGQCTSLRTFIIIPTYVSQSAVTNFLLLSGIAKLQTTLRLVSWGLTVELLKVTDMFAAKWKGPNQFKSDGTCVPVMSPIPSCYLSSDSQPPAPAQEVKKEVDLFPISKLRTLLTSHMKTNGVSIFTVSYSNTLRHTMMDRL